MAREPSFNFGANRKPKKPKKTKKKSTAKKTKAKKSSKGTAVRSNAWRAYVGGGISNAPIPD